MQLKEKFINSLSEILWFETELDNNEVKIKQWLDFGSYKINNWFRNDFEKLLNNSLSKIETLQEEDKEKVYKYILDFFALYYKWWDFGYFKSRFDSFKYRIPYSWKDTEFTWSTKDSYFVKTKDVENKIKVWMLDTEIEFIKQDNEDKWENEIEVIKEENKWKNFLVVKLYNLTIKWNQVNKFIEKIENEIKNKVSEFSFNSKEKQLLTDFLKKWWKDYFIHKNLKGFLQEELSYFVYQKIWLEEYIYIKKNSVSNLVNEILFLQDKEVLQTKKDEVKKLFDKIQDTDDIYRYYENLQRIKQIIELSENDKWEEIKKILNLSKNTELEKIKLNEFLDFERFNKLKQELETKLDNLETIVDWDTKKIVNVFNEIMNDFIDKLSEIEEIKKLIWTTKRVVLKTDNLKSGYVVSIDRILQAGWSKEFILDLITQKQIDEWKDELKLVDEDFKKEDIFNNEKYKFLPIDTKYLDEETKFELLSKFNNLEEKLDWLLIKSENFQALNTLLKKYKEQVKTIYIDPPYNTWNDGFVYKDNYNHSSWLSMMENRLKLARELMREDWVIFTSIDDNEVDNLKKLEDIVFDVYIKNIIWESWKPFWFKATKTIWPRIHEYILHYWKSEKFDYQPTYTEIKSSKWEKILTWSIIKVETDKIYSTDFIQWAKQWISSYWLSWFGSWQKPYKLIQKLILASNNKKSYILDFFAWSWTTADAVIRLNQEDWWNRKFILTELNEYFETIIIPRIKKVSFWSEWKNWKPDFDNKDAKQSWIFFKYIYLDQYEDILENLDLSKNFENFQEKTFQEKFKIFQEKIVYIYNQILIEKLKDNDFINTAIYQLWLKEIKYYLKDQAIILETDQLNIIKPLKEKITELNIDNGKDTYILQQDYNKLSDNLKIKTKILETLFLLN